MTFKPLFYFLSSVAFLVSIFWASVYHGFAGPFVVLAFFLCFLVSATMSLTEACLLKSKKTILLRFLIYILIFASIVPIMKFGFFVRNQIFLSELPRYQQVTDLLVKNAQAKSASFSVAATLPPEYSNLSDSGRVSLKRNGENVVTAMFFKGSAGVFHHEGYAFRSNDDVVALKNEFPELGFVRIAPKWYFFAD